MKVVYKKGGPSGSGAETVLAGPAVDVGVVTPTTNSKPAGVKEGDWAWSSQLKAGTYKVSVTSLGPDAGKYKAPPDSNYAVAAGDKKEVVLYVSAAKLTVEVQEADSTPVKLIELASPSR